MMIEIWKDIKGYEGLYQVSNMGRVKSLDRTITHKNGNVRFYNGYILKQTTAKNGYMLVYLYKDAKIKAVIVHRLVALAFIPNPDNKPQVNHKDENKQNNCVENLEWMTISENINYGSRNQRDAKTKSIKVVCNNIEFDSITECAKYFNTSKQCLYYYLNKIHKTPKRFIDMGLSYA